MSIASQIVNGLRHIGFALRKNAPKILTGMSVAGAVGTTVLAVTGTVKATRIVDKEKEERGVDKLPAKEVIKLTWKCYIPTATSMVVTVGTGIAANVESGKRLAAAVTLSQIAERAREEYREATSEVVGKNKAEEIQALAEQKAMINDRYDATDPECTKYGNYLMRDALTGRYFRSNRDKVENAVSRYNDLVMENDYADFGEFYDLLDLDRDFDLANYVGYSTNGPLMDVWYSTGIHPITGEPYCQINYYKFPYLYFNENGLYN